MLCSDTKVTPFASLYPVLFYDLKKNFYIFKVVSVVPLGLLNSKVSS